MFIKYSNRGQPHVELYHRKGHSRCQIEISSKHTNGKLCRDFIIGSSNSKLELNQIQKQQTDYPQGSDFRSTYKKHCEGHQMAHLSVCADAIFVQDEQSWYLKHFFCEVDRIIYQKQNFQWVFEQATSTEYSTGTGRITTAFPLPTWSRVKPEQFDILLHMIIYLHTLVNTVKYGVKWHGGEPSGKLMYSHCPDVFRTCPNKMMTHKT